MADPAVESLTKARLATLAGITILETLNARPAVPTDLARKYLSIEHDHCDVQRITLGQPAQYRESGSLFVVCQTASGSGQAAANALAEAVRGLFFEYATNHFRVLAVKSAIVFEVDNGNFFALRVPIQYQFDFFKS
jgi:hypothetical protein